MSVGSAFIKVVLVVLNLAIVGIVAMSVYAVAMEDMEVNFDEEDLVFNMTEEELSVYFPFSIKFGGYWDIEDFFYTYYLLDNNDDLLISGGDGPMRLPSGVVNNMNISASVNTSQLLDLLDEDLILNGINLTLGVSMGAKYFSSIFDFSLSVDVRIPVPPIFEEFGIDNSSFTFVGNNMDFTVNHTVAEFLQDMSFPLAVQLANQTTSLGWGASEMNFSSTQTSFSIEMNETRLQQAVVSGDMIFLRFGLPVDEENFGPSFTIDFFQLIDYEITNITHDEVEEELSINVGLNTFSIIPGSIVLNATISDGPNFTAVNDLNLSLNEITDGEFVFAMTEVQYTALGSEFELLMAVNLSFGPSFEIATNETIVP